MYLKNVSLVALAITLTAPGIAHAYLDPGTGSMVLQVLLGGLAGLAMILKLYWHRILKLFGRGKAKSQGEAAREHAATKGE